MLNSNIDFNTAVALQFSKKYSEAVSMYREIIIKEPDNHSARNNLGVALDDLGESNEAIIVLKQLICECPCYYDAHYNLGFIYRKVGLYDLAKDIYTRAIEIEPFNGKTYQQRGACYMDLLLYKNAFDDYSYALELFIPRYKQHNLLNIVATEHISDNVDFIKSILKEGLYLNIRSFNSGMSIIMPQIYKNRLIQETKDIHLGKTISRHIRQNIHKYELRFDCDFYKIFENLKRHYNEPDDHEFLNSMESGFTPLLKSLKNDNDPLYAVGAALYEEGELVAGEIGIVNNKIYHSYFGYHDKSNRGSVQIVLLFQLLMEKGIEYFDWGPSITRYDNYKFRFGAGVIGHNKSIDLFNSVNNYSNKGLLLF